MAQFITMTEKTTPLLLADYLHIIDSADTNNDKWIRAQRIVEMLGGGWTPANETWTYLSATTMTVPAGALLKYSVGMKILWTEGTTKKYAYIVSLTDTVLTFAGDAITNVTILTPYYSTAANPFGFPHWFDYTPVLTGGNAKLSGFNVAKFCITSRKVSLIFVCENRTLTGSSGNVIISLPVSALREIYNISSAYYNSGQTAIFYKVNPSSLELTKDINAGAWATSETGIYIRMLTQYDI
jgi:hypothetical protein